MGQRTSLGLLVIALCPLACGEEAPVGAPAPNPGHAGTTATPVEPPPLAPTTGGTDSTAGGTGGAAPVDPPPELGGSGGTPGAAGTGMINWPLPEDVVLSANFDHRTPAGLTEEMVLEDFGADRETFRIPEGRAEIVVDEDSGSNALRVLYPRGCVGTGACAIQFRIILERALEEAWIRYRLKFNEGFQFVRGGKLPGLCGGECNSGCESVSGSDGWSARMMWRGGGELVQYMYYPGKRSSCGDDFSWGEDAPIDQWITVKTQIVMNTPGQSDGVVRSWLDGEEVLTRTDMRYRNVEDIKIDRFYFSTFYGGSSSDWAPGTDTYISYDDFVIATVDPDGPAAE